MRRHALLPISVVLVVIASCAPRELPVAPSPEPEPEPEPEVVAPAPEPEPTLEERWRAPFAVRSSGRPAPRLAAPAVYVDESAPPPVAPAASAAATAPAAAPASAPSATQAASPAREPTRPPTSPAAFPAASPAASPAAAPAAAAGTRTHKVEWGETWYGIARRYGVAPSALAAANPQVDPERIRSGQVLRIPGADPAPRGGRRTHVVQAGDSLWGIARRYGVSADAIRTANRLPDDRVRLGQTLIIPQAETER